MVKFIQWFKEQKFEIVLVLSKEFNVKALCIKMNVSRGGYYKWIKTKDILNNYEINRNDMRELVKEYHKKHPSWGYRHINRQIKVDIG